MELGQLRYFIGIAETENFGEAARNLHIAQSALSRQIAALEVELGFLLFERLPRGVRLTPAGKIFAAEIRELLNSLDVIVQNSRKSAEGRYGSLTVGFVGSVAWHGSVPDGIAAFRKAFPHVNVSVRIDTSLNLLEEATAGVIDVAFIYNRPLTLTNLNKCLVAQHEIVLAVHEDHPFADKDQVSSKNLHGTDLIFFPRSAQPIFQDRLLAALNEKRIKPNLIQSATSMPEILSLVSTGMGVAFVNSEVKWHKPETLRLLPITDLSVPIDLDLVWAQDNRNPTVRRFLELLKANKLVLETD